MSDIKNKVIEAIKKIYDPEIPVNIYELGLIYRLEVDEKNKVEVDMTLTSPGCPVGPLIQSQIYYKLMDLDALDDVVVNIVWDPPWDPKIMASEEVKLMLGIF